MFRFNLHQKTTFTPLPNYTQRRTISNTVLPRFSKKDITTELTDHKKISVPIVTVLGVGGFGGNAINTLINMKASGTTCVAANTDAQALSISLAPRTIQLGSKLTQGRGAGSNVGIGREAGKETLQEVMDALSESSLVFIAAGMGGGTGTGAAPIIGKALRERGTPTIGVVTTPFEFEGPQKMETAMKGLREMENAVDVLVTVPNQKLIEWMPNLDHQQAREKVDQILCDGVKGVTDLIYIPGEMNVDFADLCTVIRSGGRALFGIGEGSGEKRAEECAKNALNNPLFDDLSRKGAKGILINIYADNDLRMEEISTIARIIREGAANDAIIKYGLTLDKSMKGKVKVSFVMAGLHPPTLFDNFVTNMTKFW
eukprot:TRINITY_DN5453_c0_g1_i1.p1 TRINITY_DN5453_c0_g1~~TRINITY_DN5453_c0_g1_i1.p1  ORF type:complete len:371 (-),score=114.95 TRINITY_DN5453_c0_g1_i1:73-1185(-)